MTSAYIILGTPDSGRREILADLIANGTANPDDIRVYFAGDLDDAAVAAFAETVAAAQAAEGTAADAAAATTAPAAPQIRRWGFADGNLFADSPETAPGTVFIVTNGRKNPIDQMEILAALLPRFGWQLARVFTVVHCGLFAAHTELADWYKACLHFSDVALLSRRETLPDPNAVVKKFTDAHKAAHNPCLLEIVKKGRLDNPLRVLIPEARRFSMIFDDTDGLDEMDFDENNLPEEPFDIKPGTDPYFERDTTGRRCIHIPEIEKFLG
ncbi:MAG: hypothetical protein LBT53_00075 [Puniceicoccales bacterium]|nr:hypothetical protein [Puniceicoccales bacterium]